MGSEQAVYDVWGRSYSAQFYCSRIILLGFYWHSGMLASSLLFHGHCSIHPTSSPFDWIGGFASAAICKEK